MADVCVIVQLPDAPDELFSDAAQERIQGSAEAVARLRVAVIERIGAPSSRILATLPTPEAVMMMEAVEEAHADIGRGECRP